MKYLDNEANLVRTAALVATNIEPSHVIFRTDQLDKIGGGDVVASGDFVGQSDQVIDVEIVDNTITGTPSTSTPIFTGDGNATLDDLAVDATVEVQQITITVVDMGTQTFTASAPFQGVTVKAKTPGAGGNAITIAVDRSGLILTETDFSLVHDLQQGGNGNTGDEWNWGNALIDVNTGNVPAAAPRVSVGFDPQVYRLFKTFDGSAYTYYTSPDVVRAVPAGSRVFTVDGNYFVTVSDGVNPDEHYTGQTLYSILTQMQDSDIVDLTGQVIVNDLKPNGMAIDDLSVYTASYVQGVIADGSDALARAVTDFVVAVEESSPTENVLIKCVDATTLNEEVWSVYGSISGELPNATTGVPYSGGTISFTIPETPPPIDSGGDDTGTGATTGDIFVELLLKDRGAGVAQTPSLTVVKPILGSEAVDGEWIFQLGDRPPPPCGNAGDLIGGPREECLGVNPGGLGGGEAVSDTSTLIRVQRLTAAVREFVGNNTSPQATVAALDVSWIEGSAAIFLDALKQLATGTDPSPWVASHTYFADDLVVPTVQNGYRYAASFDTGITGAAGSSEPDWSTALSIGDTVDDGAVTWTNIGKTAYLLYDEYFEAWKDEMGALSGTGSHIVAVEWHAHISANTFFYIRPTVRNGWLYRINMPGWTGTIYTGSVEPTWPLAFNVPIDDGEVTEIAFSNYWTATSAYTLGRIANPGTGDIWTVTTAGTTDSSEPDWDVAGPITDGTVVWTKTAATDLSNSQALQQQSYFERFKTQMTEVLAAAGIVVNFEGAGLAGSGCWQDQGGSQWWVYQGSDALLPVQTGVYYHAAKKGLNANGDEIIIPLKLFGFGPQINCPELLVNGDAIRVATSGLGTGGTGGGGHSGGYQQGDVISVRTVHADPVGFTGGADGDDTVTLSVVGTEHVFANYALVNAAARLNSTAYAVGMKYVPAVANGHWYVCTVAGTTAGSPPSFPTNGSTYSDGTATFQDGGTLAYDDDGLSFIIHNGTLPLSLGSNWVFSVEGGRARWRVNGGAWTTIDIAPSVSIGSDGLALEFQAGQAPSWVPADAWTFKAEATNGPNGLKSLDDDALAWEDDLTLTITPSDHGVGDISTAVLVFIGDHTIPADAEIKIQGSADNFATTPFEQVLAWRERDMFAIFSAPQTYQKFRLVVDDAGSIQWLFLGAGLDLALVDGVYGSGGASIRELGDMIFNLGLPSVLQRQGLSVDVTHNLISRTSMNALAALLKWAGENEEGRFGIIPNDNHSDCAIVVVNASDSKVSFSDEHKFQPATAADSAITVTMNLEAIP